MSENNNNLFEEENFLFGKNKENPFAAPQGYFDSLSDKVMNKIEVEQERAQFTVLSTITPPQPSPKGRGCFTVPQNYFIKNGNLLEYKYELATFSELSKVPKPVLKPVTSEYFDALSANVLKQIELADELKNYSTLAEIKKEKAFAVDLDYFETIADRVKERYHSTENKKVSIIEQVLTFIFKPQLTIAYGLVLIVGIGAFLFFNQPEKIIESGDCKTLACLERKELLNDHTIQSLDDENLYDLVDADELGKQLSTAGSLVINNTDSLPQQ